VEGDIYLKYETKPEPTLPPPTGNMRISIFSSGISSNISIAIVPYPAII